MDPTKLTEYPASTLTTLGAAAGAAVACMGSSHAASVAGLTMLAGLGYSALTHTVDYHAYKEDLWIWEKGGEASYLPYVTTRMATAAILAVPIATVMAAAACLGPNKLSLRSIAPWVAGGTGFVFAATRVYWADGYFRKGNDQKDLRDERDQIEIIALLATFGVLLPALMVAQRRIGFGAFNLFRG